MLLVHHLNQSRSTRVLWLLEELGLPYRVELHQRDPASGLAPESLRAVHPLAKAPVLQDNDITLAESASIIEYLLSLVPETKLRPQPSAPEYWHYNEWLHFAEGSFAMPVVINMIMAMEERGDKNKPLDGYIGKELALDLSYVEYTLTRRQYFAGDCFTAADIMMSMILLFAEKQGLLTGYPNCLSYLNRTTTRPAFVAAMKYQ